MISNLHRKNTLTRIFLLQVCPVNYKEVERVLKQNGFALERQNTGSHRQYTVIINGRKQRVTLAYHRINDHVPIGTLRSIIRQSTLDREFFRKNDSTVTVYFVTS